MQEITAIEGLDSVIVRDQEKLRKGEYKKRLREENLQAEMQANMEKNAELKARMDRVVQKVGKPLMARSTKKRVKKEIKEEKVDEERLDIIRYLGEDMAQLTE
jgi:hypothetical protein